MLEQHKVEYHNRCQQLDQQRADESDKLQLLRTTLSQLRIQIEKVSCND